MALILLVTVFCMLAKISDCQIKLVPQVQTEEGIVRGVPQKSRANREFMAFEGMRYVEKPDRFAEAKPLERWEGVVDASEGKPVCSQLLPGALGAMLGPMGEEDCLFINVYTPHLNEAKLFPVMVWIHGGAFIIGSGTDYGATYFMDEDIILVTFNYRIGVLGFLYLEDDTIPGNLGMKDQVMALKWVQRNIHHFGGDPQQVTIFGESAGGASVHLHILSNLSTGLFQRAIAQSGSGVNPWAISSDPKWNAIRFAQKLECPTDNSKVIVECLKAASVEEIIDAQVETVWGPIMAYHFAPVVEVGNDLDRNTAFLTRKPREMMEKKEVANPVPLMLGLMKNEGALIFSGMILNDPQLILALNQNWLNLAPLMFIFHNRLEYNPRVPTAAEKIRHFYFSRHHVGPATEQRLTDAFSDRFFVHGVHYTAASHSELAPVYPYVFTFYDGFSTLHLLDYHFFDAPTHADDIPYLFPFLARPDLGTKVEEEFSKNLVRLWASFSRTGKPTELWDPVVEWPAHNHSEGMTWLQIDRRTQLLRDPFSLRVKFWEELLGNDLQGFY